MLLKKYPETIAGMKDSSGDWNNTRTMLDNFAADGFDVFTGSETFCWKHAQWRRRLHLATANVNPGAIVKQCHGWRQSDAEQQQQLRLDQIRTAVAG